MVLSSPRLWLRGQPDSTAHVVGDAGETDLLPDVLDWVQLWGTGRQEDQRDVGRHDELDTSKYLASSTRL